MIVFGQVALLAAFVACGYAGFACTVGWRRQHAGLRRSGQWAAALGSAALSAVVFVLAWALLVKDFRFAYVAQYSRRSLEWHYSLSAMWVGQAGSLLVWTWMVAIVAIVYGRFRAAADDHLREPAFAVLTLYLAFLVAVMVFGADPVAPSLAPPADGAGLGPLLQHPAMLAHPPAVFLGYALWAVPFALAAAALVSGRLRGEWVRHARPWALLAWSAQGIGILLGAEWAYEELGWGGYWAWDPVENGSLLPWLAGTAMIHAALAWQHRGVLKKTALLTAILTFGLCNFAAFLTRSGVFGGLHEFSRSPIAWMFLALLVFLAVAGPLLAIRRRSALRGDRPLAGVWTRESLVAISALALLLLTAVVWAGTLAGPISQAALGREINVGAAFYNRAAMPLALLLTAATALAPLVRWGGPPRPLARRGIALSAGWGAATALAAWGLGVRSLLGLAVAALAAAAVVAVVVSVALDCRPRPAEAAGERIARVVGARRRQYAGYVMHLGFVSLIVGVVGSSLGTRSREATMTRGETIEWSGHSIRLADLAQRRLPEKTVVEARLEIARDGQAPVVLLPAQHFHLPVGQWTTEVAIHSTWGGDYYAIVHGGTGRDQASVTLMFNPLMRWIWLSGAAVLVGAGLALWPARPSRAAPPSPVDASAERPRPHYTKSGRRAAARANAPVGHEATCDRRQSG